MMEGFIPREQVINLILDLRNKFDEAFDGYIGDVVVSDFRMDIDETLKELT